MNIKLGAYEILEEIGKGGMATVYRAYHRNMDRDVAIKVIKNSIIDDENTIERFQQEARVIARLEHPHILPVYDFDGSSTPPYIVMRYLDGGTLKDVMKHGLLPLTEVTHVIQQIASALDYAHRQGIVHRDIKPSNIMVDREGNVFVSDLGIARITGGMVGGRRGITASGAIVGTPEYMSPEQAMGVMDINYHADIYSLGVMLFEMVTGKLPFDEPTAMGTILKHIQSPVPSVTDINSELPDELEDVIRLAMAKEPDERYASANDMARHLLKITGAPDDGPVELKKAAATSVSIRTLHPVSLSSEDKSSGISTGSSETPAEQQRQITVIHVNLADFEEILLEVNPEETKHQLGELMKRIHPLIEQGGGVIREQTDTVLQALWGVYEIREDNPEVAIQTALKIQFVAKLFTKKWLGDDEPAPVQIGIDTGAVVVRREEDGSISSSGQAINYAARIERAAPPGSIIITYDTFRHVIGVFNVLRETPVRVRGRTEPIDVYVVQSARPRAFRFQTRGVEGIETKMIGRDSELKLMQDAMLLCIEDAETQMITVTAEAGVGKSRLLYEFSRWIDVIDKVIFFFEGRATQQTTNLPYALVRSILSFRFEILDSDTIPLMREKLVGGVQQFMGEDSGDAAAFIGQLVGFDFSDHPAVQPILSSVDAFQKRAEEYLNAFFRSIAKTPAIIELEDIHWADHQSLDLINQLVTQNQHLPLMVICMARPQLHERRPGWGEGQDFHHRLELKPLSKLDSRRLLREVLQLVDDIPTELRDLIIDRADGNPFYVEELVKILIEDGVIIKNDDGDNKRWRVNLERLKMLRVPPTLTGVLQARLDTLDPMARLLLGRASVIGRIFWTSAVDYLHKADGFHIHNPQELLDDLRQREMIFLREKSDFANTDEYVIKHAILRDVIYESLLKRQQREYHKAAAEWLIEVSAERADEYTGLIAEHYELAEEPVKAAGYLLTAGKKANLVAAMNEARILLEHAHAILPEEGDDAKRIRVEIQIEQVETHYRRWQTTEVDELGRDTLKLAREVGDKTNLAYILAHLGLNANRRGHVESSKSYLLEADALLDDIKKPAVKIFVLRQIGNHYTTSVATTEKGLVYFEQSLAIARETKDIYGEASAYNAIGNAYLSLNRVPEAIEVYEKGAALSRQLGDTSQMCVLLMNFALTHYYLRDYPKALKVNQEVMTLLEQIGASINNSRLQIAQTLVQMETNHDEVIKFLKPSLAESIEANNLGGIQEALEVCAYLAVRAKEYEHAAELIGVCYTSPLYDPDFLAGQIHLNDALATIKQHLPETEVEAAIARGKAMDMTAVAKSLLAELETA